MMKSLDEAIKHCDEVADVCEDSASKCDLTDAYESSVASREGKCASDYRQLAEWLRILKAYGQARKTIQDTIEELKTNPMKNTYFYGLQLAEQIIHELVDEEECEWNTQ